MEDKDFEALLQGYTPVFRRGDLVKGFICTSDSNGIGVDIGDKAIAFCPKKEILEDLLKGQEEQFLITDFDEKEERFKLEFVEPDYALEINKKEKHKASKFIMLERESKILEILISEGYFNSEEKL